MSLSCRLYYIRQCWTFLSDSLIKIFRVSVDAGYSREVHTFITCSLPSVIRPDDVKFKLFSSMSANVFKVTTKVKVDY